MKESSGTLLLVFCGAISLVLVTMCCSKGSDPAGGEREESRPDSTKVFETVEGIPFRNMIGINGFEWDFLGSNNELDALRTALIKPFDSFRHYLDWGRMETKENVYAFQPSLSGSWNYDDIYRWCKENEVTVLACIKTIPDWLQKTYPPGERDDENAPLPFGAKKDDPASYIQFARLGFQFAARYGSNTHVNPDLVLVTAEPHWAPNQKKIGLGLVRYMECNNEPDRWWKGDHAHQSPEEYAANLSAFYDGHLGRLGPGVGVKHADPQMTVVMGGLAKPDAEYVLKMIEWCRKHRGLKEDGTINLCFDVINYHHYSFSNEDIFTPGTRGRAPELSSSPAMAVKMLQVAKEYAGDMDVWLTELGYDVNPKSPLRAMPIKGKSVLNTHADWILRSSLLYARLGIKRLHYYMLYDVDEQNNTQFASSGFAAHGKRRPALDYLSQVKELMGDYKYTRTIHDDPIIDVYSRDDKEIYVLVVPDETGRETDYRLTVNGADKVDIYMPQADADDMLHRTVETINGTVNLRVSETPVFVRKR